MNNAIVLIDGENFLHKVKEVVGKYKKRKEVLDITKVQVNDLIKSVFKDIPNLKIDDIIFYSAKLSVNKADEVKSKELIDKHRRLKNTLEKSGIKFKYSGHVRGYEGKGKSKNVIFKEKGVDVGIAVDLVCYAFDKKYKTVILCSSDSDLQPAVKEAIKRGINVIYLGFTINPNKGLGVTTTSTVLFRDNEVLNSVSK